MKKSVAFIAAAAFAFSFLSLSLTSCDSFNGGQNFAADGAICVRLPDQSQLAGQAAAEKLSGSVSSDGTLNGASVDSFKVTVRNVALKTETSQTVAPGSIVTIDKLSEGSYDVAVFGYGADSQANPSYYGNARAVAVTAGKTSTANVVLSRLTERPGVSFSFSAVDLQNAFLTYSCDEMGKSGEAFYSFTTPGGTDLVKPPMPIFMEPGYNYKVKVVFYGMSNEAKYICSAEGVVPASGGLVSGSASMVDKGFVPLTNYTAPLLLGNSPADYFKDNVSFSLEGESVPAENVSFHAINDKACGFTVPFIASYQEYSCLLMPSVVHPVTAPNVSVADMQVPKGETKEVAVSYNPPAPVNWPVLGQLPDTQNGFTSYGVTSYDSDTWQGEAACQQSYSNYIKASDDKKSIIGIGVSPSPCPCVWTVSVTHGAHGQMNDTSASANFNVSCVEATQPSGGGGGSGGIPAPADFVFVEGATINTAISGSSVFLDGRKIVIPDMYVCSHEVTQKEWTTYMKDRGFSTSYGKGDDYPANYTSWFNALIYCNLRSATEGLDPVYYITVDTTNDTDSMDYPAGNRSYDVTEWESKLSTSPVSSGSAVVTKDVDGKYNMSEYSVYTHIAYPCRGFTMDKSRNGYRLLTEAEWEYCARGGKDGIAGTQYTHSGNYTVNSNAVDNVAWYSSNSGGKMHLITDHEKTAGIDSANLLGIYDMCGNVAEWVYDWFGWQNINASTPETGYVYTGWNNQNQILKGGYFDSGASYCTVNQRDSRNTYCSSESGLRICRNKDTRTITGFNGTWCLSPPMARTISSTGVVDFKIFNDAATSSDYANIDKSKLVVEYGDTSGTVEHTYTGESDGVTIEPKSDGVVWKINNPNTATSGAKMYRFYYDGVEIAYNRVFAN